MKLVKYEFEILFFFQRILISQKIGKQKIGENDNIWS